MNNIQLILCTKNKGYQITKALFLAERNEFIKVIGFKEQEILNPKSTYNYMRLKAHYQNLERRNKKAKSFQDDIQIVRYENKEIRIQSKGSPCYLYKALAIYKNVIQNKNLCCEYCKKELSINNLTLDHFIPQSAGGMDTSDNLNVSCFFCNKEKSSINPINDIELFNHWKNFISLKKKDYLFLDYLLDNKIYSTKDFNYLLSKIQTSVGTKIKMYLLMIKEEIKIELTNFHHQFNEIIASGNFSEKEINQIKTITEYVNNQK